MVDKICFNDVLPPDTSIYDPFVRTHFEKLISFKECHKVLVEQMPLLAREPYRYDPNCSLHSKFSLSIVKIEPFIEPFNDPLLFRMASIFAFGRQLQNNIQSEVCRRVSAIGELLAPYMRGASANLEDAQKCLVDTVRRLICYPSLTTITKLTKKHILNATDYGGPLAAYKTVVKRIGEIPITRKTTFTDEKGESTLTPELAMKLLQLMAIHADEKFEEIIQISHIQVALLTEDEEDPAFLCEVADYLFRKCSERTTIDQELVKALRDTYANICNTKIAFQVFAVWSEIFPGEDKKVKRTLKEGLKAKIICLYTIKKAFQAFPDFCWRHLCDIPEYGKEISNVAEALMVLQQEPFCGFDKEYYASICPTQFPNFAAACRDLLIRCKGCIYLRTFPEFISIPAEENKIVDLTEAYSNDDEIEKFKGKLATDVALALYIARDITCTGQSGFLL